MDKTAGPHSVFELAFPKGWASKPIALSLDSEIVSSSWIVSCFTATPVEVDSDAVFVFVVMVDVAVVDGVNDAMVVAVVVVVSDDQNDISNRSLCFGLRRCL